MEAHGDDVEAWKKDPWSKLPTWGKWTVGVVGALVLLVIGAAIGSGGEEDTLKAELADTEAVLTRTADERDKAEGEANDLLARRDQIIARAKSSARDIVGGARSEQSTLSREVKSLQDEVDAAESELSQTESSVASAKREKALSKINDGIWQAEVDFIPGTYRAPGGSGCYWALLNSADTNDIANNGGFGPNQTITIDSAWFETSDCGTWERVE